MTIITKTREDVIDELAAKKTLADSNYFDAWTYQGYVHTFSRMSRDELQDTWNCLMSYSVVILGSYADEGEKTYEPTCPKANV